MNKEIKTILVLMLLLFMYLIAISQYTHTHENIHKLICQWTGDPNQNITIRYKMFGINGGETICEDYGDLKLQIENEIISYNTMLIVLSMFMVALVIIIVLVEVLDR